MTSTSFKKLKYSINLNVRGESPRKLGLELKRKKSINNKLPDSLVILKIHSFKDDITIPNILSCLSFFQNIQNHFNNEVVLQEEDEIIAVNGRLGLNNMVEEIANIFMEEEEENRHNCINFTIVRYRLDDTFNQQLYTRLYNALFSDRQKINYLRQKIHSDCHNENSDFSLNSKYHFNLPKYVTISDCLMDKICEGEDGAYCHNRDGLKLFRSHFEINSYLLSFWYHRGKLSIINSINREFPTDPNYYTERILSGHIGHMFMSPCERQLITIQNDNCSIVNYDAINQNKSSKICVIWTLDSLDKINDLYLSILSFKKCMDNVDTILLISEDISQNDDIYLLNSIFTFIYVSKGLNIRLHIFSFIEYDCILSVDSCIFFKSSDQIISTFFQDYGEIKSCEIRGVFQKKQLISLVLNQNSQYPMEHDPSLPNTSIENSVKHGDIISREGNLSLHPEIFCIINPSIDIYEKFLEHCQYHLEDVKNFTSLINTFISRNDDRITLRHMSTMCNFSMKISSDIKMSENNGIFTDNAHVNPFENTPQNLINILVNREYDLLPKQHQLHFNELGHIPMVCNFEENILLYDDKILAFNIQGLSNFMLRIPENRIIQSIRVDYCDNEYFRYQEMILNRACDLIIDFIRDLLREHMEAMFEKSSLRVIRKC